MRGFMGGLWLLLQGLWVDFLSFQGVFWGWGTGNGDWELGNGEWSLCDGFKIPLFILGLDGYRAIHFVPAGIVLLYLELISFGDVLSLS